MPDLYSEITDKMPGHTQDLCRRAAVVYERCRRYSGRLIHDVNCFAGRLLNGVRNLAGAWDIDLAGRNDAAKIEELRREFEEDLKQWLTDGLKTLGEELRRDFKASLNRWLDDGLKTTGERLPRRGA